MATPRVAIAGRGCPVRHCKRERDDRVEREMSGRLEWRESGKVGQSREGGAWS
jgi:hypothetical protein